MNEEFEDFDGETFDPNNFAGQNAGANFAGLRTSAAPIGSGSTMITIKVVNAQAAAATAEIFGFGTGVAAGVDDAGLTALASLAGPPLAVAGNAANISRMYFDKNGDFVFQDAANALMRISCNEMPYKQLLMGTLFGKFKINRIRFTPTTDAQIDNIIEFREKTMFGKTWQDSINPRQYFRPDQFQTKIIDIPYNWVMNQERAFRQRINAAETVTYALQISQVLKAQK